MRRITWKEPPTPAFPEADRSALNSAARPPLRVAVLGCGEGAQRHHLPALAGLRGVRVAAVADLDPGCLAAAGRQVPGSHIFTDWRAAIEQAEVDAAVVCLPSSLHADAAVATLERGLHVYVEKPLALTVADADQTVQAWRRAGVVGMTGFNYRFNRLYRSARRILGSGRLGAVVAARSAFTIASARLPAWKLAPGSGGGALPDLGSHHADLVQWLFGEPVEAVSAVIRSRASVEDTAHVSLRLAGGLVVQSLFAYGAVDEERLEVYGSAGKLVVDRGRHQDAFVEPATRARLKRVLAGARDLSHVGYILEKRFAPGHEPSHRTALAAFADAVRTGVRATPDLADGRAAVAVVEAAERSAHSGRFEPVGHV